MEIFPSFKILKTLLFLTFIILTFGNYNIRRNTFFLYIIFSHPMEIFDLCKELYGLFSFLPSLWKINEFYNKMKILFCTWRFLSLKLSINFRVLCCLECRLVPRDNLIHFYLINWSFSCCEMIVTKKRNITLKIPWI